MINALLTIAAIVLFFAAMYAYAYGFEYLENLKERRLLKERIKKEADFAQQRLLKAQLRQEKFKKLRKRSDEIKQEFARLAEFRNKVFKTNNSDNIMA